MSYQFFSVVIKGLGKGIELGFPTANLERPANFTLPYGVYAVLVLVKGQKYQGAMHYGERTILNKEFPQKPPQKWVSLELHIIGFSEDILGKRVKVNILKKIREVKEFANFEDLKEQIEKDVEVVKKLKFITF